MAAAEERRTERHSGYSGRFSDYNESNFAETDYTEHALVLKNIASPRQDLFRPSIAGQRYVGFFTLDRNTQTEVSEIVDLKEMTEVLQSLMQDVNTLKKEIHFSKTVMRADFESKLQQKALELYVRVNERVSELEKIHQERVNTVRRAFRQQLADALVHVGSLYSDNADSKLKKQQKKESQELKKVQFKLKESDATITRLEGMLEMLKVQLMQHTKQTEEEEIESIPPKSPEINAEAEELREELSQMEYKLNELQENLSAKDDAFSNLSIDMENVTEQLEKQKSINEKMKSEMDKMRASSEQDRNSARKLLEQKRLEFEKEMVQKSRQIREEVLAMARQEAASLQDSERGKLVKLTDEKNKLEALLAQERSKNATKVPTPPPLEDTDTEKVKASELKWRQMVARMKKEVDRTHKMWERKFAILQQSLHALKDESFLRQTLQKQAATLHHAAVSYTTDMPLGIVPKKKKVPTATLR